MTYGYCLAERCSYKGLLWDDYCYFHEKISYGLIDGYYMPTVQGRGWVELHV